MEKLLIAGGIIVFAGIVAAIIVFSILRGRKRTAALEALAGQMNFSFSKKGGYEPKSRLGVFNLFNQGHSRKMINVMQGRTEKLEVTILDYSYTVGGGQQQQTNSQTVICLRGESLRLPVFTLRPEHIFHRIGKVFGYQDIDFDEHPVFSKRYLLRGEDEDRIRAIFNEKVISYYEGQKGLSTEGVGDALIFYRLSKRVPPAEIGAFMQEGFTVLGLFKG